MDIAVQSDVLEPLISVFIFQRQPSSVQVRQGLL